MVAMAEIIVGTSGYSYEDWVGPFYPPGTDQSDFLTYYARHFSMTELNFSYYRQPSAQTVQGMVDRTPPQFRFSIKAHRSMTHDVSGGWRNEVDRFRDGIRPLVENDRLLGVLLQFPYRFHYTVGNRRYLASLCKALDDLPLYLEFRHKEWQRESVFTQMDEMGLGLVFTDMPSLRGLPESPIQADGGSPGDSPRDGAPDRPTRHGAPPGGSPRDGSPSGGAGRRGAATGALPLVPGRRAYIRFHGRNEKNWWEGDNTTRYDYRYSEEELAQWLPVISALSGRTSVLVIAFNNHANGNAVANARQLIAMLSNHPNTSSLRNAPGDG